MNSLSPVPRPSGGLTVDLGGVRAWSMGRVLATTDGGGHDAPRRDFVSGRLVLCMGLAVYRDVVGVGQAARHAFNMMAGSRGAGHRADAFSLGFDACDHLSRRLRVWSVVLGDGHVISIEDVRGMLSGLVGRGRAHLVVDALDLTGRLREEHGRLLIMALLLAGEALPRGGSVGLSVADASVCRITSFGPGAVWRPSVIEAFAGGALPEVPNWGDALAMCLAAMAQGAGARASIGQSDVRGERELHIELEFGCGGLWLPNAAEEGELPSCDRAGMSRLAESAAATATTPAVSPPAL